MQKQAPTLGRLLVMVVFALSCFGLLLFLWLSFGGTIPLGAQTYSKSVTQYPLGVSPYFAKRAKGKKSTHALYVRSTLNRFFFGTERSRRHPPLRLSAPGLLEPRDVFAALVCNTDPWTYLGSRPVRTRCSSAASRPTARSTGRTRAPYRYRPAGGWTSTSP